MPLNLFEKNARRVTSAGSYGGVYGAKGSNAQDVLGAYNNRQGSDKWSRRALDLQRLQASQSGAQNRWQRQFQAAESQRASSEFARSQGLKERSQAAQESQFGQKLDWDKSQFGSDLDFRKAQQAAQESQFLKTFNQGASQYDRDLALRKAQQAAQESQFAEQLGLNRSQFNSDLEFKKAIQAVQEEQFLKNFTQGKTEFDKNLQFQRDKLAADSGLNQDKYDLDLANSEYEQRLLEKQAEYQQDRADRMAQIYNLNWVNRNNPDWVWKTWSE
jgi:hypothetical protein